MQYNKQCCIQQYNINLAVINTMQLSVIIVNYNVKYFLEQCLCSVVKASYGLQTEIFVVDNNSTDGSKDFFKDKFSGIKFIWNDSNLGFAKANNIAVNQATGKYILFLNPDTIVPEDCFKKCILFFESNSDTGALGVKMLDGSGKFLKESKRSFPSPVTSLYKLTGFAKAFPHSKAFSKYYLGNLDENQNNEVDVLAGAFMIIPKKIIDIVGSFDEIFFMYGEDIDMSYRIQKAGYKNYYFAETTIIHFKGESTRKGNLNYVKIFYKAMSIFARKHYGGQKGKVFNFFIQIAIFFRAIFSAAANFIRWIGLPMIDAATILLSFWVIKLLWNLYVKKEVNYSPNMLIIAFPVFTLIFLAVSYYSGLYDNGYKQKRLNNSTAVAFLILLSCYALLPESLRFSRGILVFGSLLAFILITLIRRLLVNWKLLTIAEAHEHRQTIIACTQEDFSIINRIMDAAGMRERVLGRVAINEIEERGTIGHLGLLKSLVTTYSIKEIIFCERELSFKKIIEEVEKLPQHLRIKFHAADSRGIVGSDSKNEGGKIISAKEFRLSAQVSQRNKKLIDITISLFFILTFPFHFLLQKKPSSFFKNVFSVLFLHKTWVGYAFYLKELPKLKPGVLSTTGLPSQLNSLPDLSLQSADEWYAAEYEVWEDVKIIRKNYKYLSA
ncbi:MAG: glycosyltransferase family 2 protein [Bacteroidota bacterium]|nr:glycosyltransferase family 2 protein [Bacteroidota bacterium]